MVAQSDRAYVPLYLFAVICVLMRLYFCIQDIGPAIGKAFTDCVKKASNGATLYVPPGNYNMQTWQTLDDGTKWAFQLDGIITRTSKSRSIDFSMLS